MEIPPTCRTPFDVICHCMEEKLAYASTEQVVLILNGIEPDLLSLRFSAKRFQIMVLGYGALAS